MSKVPPVLSAATAAMTVCDTSEATLVETGLAPLVVEAVLPQGSLRSTPIATTAIPTTAVGVTACVRTTLAVPTGGAPPAIGDARKARAGAAIAGCRDHEHPIAADVLHGVGPAHCACSRSAA